MAIKVVTNENLGSDFDLGNVEAGKLNVKVDETSIKRVGGKLVVDMSVVGGVSADAGNLLTVGTDGKALIDVEAVQDAVGQAIMAGTGIEYDDAANMISSAIAGMAAGNTDSVKATLDTTNPKNPVITAEIIIDPAADNLAKVNPGAGLYVGAGDITSAVKGASAPQFAVDAATAGSEQVELTVFADQKAGFSIEPVSDVFGNALNVAMVKTV